MKAATRWRPENWLEGEIELMAFALANPDCDVRAVLRGFAELVHGSPDPRICPYCGDTGYTQDADGDEDNCARCLTLERRHAKAVKEMLDDYQSREAACCQEGVSFDEHIALLQKQVANSRRYAVKLEKHAKALSDRAWQPIGTVPETLRFIIAAWVCAEDMPSDVGECTREPGGWMCAVTGELVQPTHWQMLPYPPKAATD